jgi:outer membrane protein TolC
MKAFLLICVFLAAGWVYGQVPDTLTLEYCHEQAISSHPAARRTDLLDDASQIEQRKLNANYFPEVQLNGQASYQSDVTQVDVLIPPFYIPPPIDIEFTPSPLETPVPPNDQYKITMDVHQVIYDGGMTGRRKQLERDNYEIEIQKTIIELHTLKEQVNSVFFSIILMGENIKLLDIMLEELGQKLDDASTAVKYGAALPSDRDIIRAEIIRVEQQLEETSIQRTAFLEILSELLSEELPESVLLSLPDHKLSSVHPEPQRPELKLFEQQMTLLEHSKDMVTSTWMPKLSGFGQLGYGNPGLNFLKDEWGTFYVVGARLNWQLWNWNQNRKEKEILGIRQDIVGREKETFDKNLSIALQQHQADMQKYERLMQSDMEIIALREKIAATASSQYDNGVITSSDYVSRLNEKTQARLNMEVHRVKLAKARVDYLTALGIL